MTPYLKIEKSSLHGNIKQKSRAFNEVVVTKGEMNEIRS